MTFEYAKMPKGDDWLEKIPPRYVDGKKGFDLRIVHDLADVGVRCYTLDDLANGPGTIPPAIPVFIDWLENIDQRVPGPDERRSQRWIIRMGLIRNLIDPAAKGNERAINVIVDQLRHHPPLSTLHQYWASKALELICSPDDFALISQLISELEPGDATKPLVDFLGKVRTSESKDLLLRQLDIPEVRANAIRSLTRMKATGARQHVGRHADDPSDAVRDLVQKALEKLPT